jgi:hypothetical protein
MKGRQIHFFHTTAYCQDFAMYMTINLCILSFSKQLGFIGN